MAGTGGTWARPLLKTWQTARRLRSPIPAGGLFGETPFRRASAFFSLATVVTVLALGGDASTWLTPGVTSAIGSGLNPRLAGPSGTGAGRGVEAGPEDLFPHGGGLELRTLCKVPGHTEAVCLFFAELDWTIEIATFGDSITGATHEAWIDWGDGVFVPGVVDEAGGVVRGRHVYSSPGLQTITVSVRSSHGEIVADVFRVAVLPPINTYGAAGATQGRQQEQEGETPEVAAPASTSRGVPRGRDSRDTWTWNGRSAV